MIASLPRGTKLGVGDSATVNLHTKDGRGFDDVLTAVDNPSRFAPNWSITKGDDVVSVSDNGTITALAAGDATVEAKIPGLAARSGFLFIKALGQVGFYADGEVNWDIAILVGGFGLTLFLSQLLSGWACQPTPAGHCQQDHPVMITGMFLFFPLPAGVLLYGATSSRHCRPSTHRSVARQSSEDSGSAMTQQTVAATATSVSSGDSRLPFEPKGGK